MSQTQNSSSSRSRRQTIAISLFIIVVCIAIGLYAVGRDAGNSGDEIAMVDAPKCEAATDQGAQLASLAVGTVSEYQAATLPQNFSSIAFKDGTGADRTIGDFEGKTLFVNLWATWCGPCRAEMPGINAMSEALEGDRFEVIALSLDQGEPSVPQAFLDEIGTDALELYQDNTNAVFLDLRERGLLSGLPASYVIGPDGCLLGSVLGPAEWNDEAAIELLEAARDL
ncbi:MAG: TlpA disulfide reductase family protein [Pseudomonadota bacterium]